MAKKKAKKNSNTICISKILKIRVTRDDIKNGKPNSGDLCPIALAIRKAIPDARDVHVDGYDIVFSLNDLDLRYDVPSRAQDFIEAFDDLELALAKPFSFEADLSAIDY